MRIRKHFHITLFQTTTIEFHSQGDVSIPCIWMKTDKSGFDWFHQSVNDNTVLVVFSFVYLQKRNKICLMYRSLKSLFILNICKKTFGYKTTLVKLTTVCRSCCNKRTNEKSRHVRRTYKNSVKF